MNKHAPTIADEVMQQIKHGNVRMKPRLYFTLLSIVSFFAVFAAGFAVSYLSSIVFFWLRVETASTMAYGARRNLNEAIASFPWWAVFVAAGLVLLAVILVRKHGTMYRHKAGVVALAIVLLSVIIGFLMYLVGVGSSGTNSHSGSDSNTRGRGWQQKL